MKEEGEDASPLFCSPPCVNIPSWKGRCGSWDGGTNCIGSCSEMQRHQLFKCYHRHQKSRGKHKSEASLPQLNVPHDDQHGTWRCLDGENLTTGSFETYMKERLWLDHARSVLRHATREPWPYQGAVVTNEHAVTQTRLQGPVGCRKQVYLKTQRFFILKGGNKLRVFTKPA